KAGRGPVQGLFMQAPITSKGAQRLRAELEELKSVQRPAVINAIAEARAHGDLKENAEYHAAREQQGFIEGRIKQLEAELSHAQVIGCASLNAGSKIVFGATVDLADADTDEERTYQIVGDLEADIKKGLIAISSPVARALIGRHEGDSVSSAAPGGDRAYEIAAVRYEGRAAGAVSAVARDLPAAVAPAHRGAGRRFADVALSGAGRRR